MTTLALGALACGLGGPGPAGEVQEQVEAVQEQVESAQEQVEEQSGAPDAGSPLMDECPVAATADIEAATGSGVAVVQTVDTPDALLCSIGLEDGSVFQIQVTMSGGGGERTGAYESLLNNAMGEGSAVDGPWDEGMYFPDTGLIFRTAENVVWINLGDNQAAAVQLGSAVVGRLPYTVGG